MRSIIHITKPRNGVFKLKVTTSFFRLERIADDDIEFRRNDLLQVHRETCQATGRSKLVVELPLGFVGQEIHLTTNGDQARAIQIQKDLIAAFAGLAEYPRQYFV